MLLLLPLCVTVHSRVDNFLYVWETEKREIDAFGQISYDARSPNMNCFWNTGIA
jgi:hypothetical protein